MIAALAGTVLLLEGNALVLEVQGVGFRVFVPEGTLRHVQPGDHLRLYTEMIVHQPSGEIQLVGFAEREELSLFRTLTSVTGVGARTAMNLLGKLTPEQIRTAIVNEQPEILAQVSGVGRKVARRLVVELRDKLAPAPVANKADAEQERELLQALMALGYSATEARAAIQAVQPEAPFEEKLRQALSYFAR